MKMMFKVIAGCLMFGTYNNAQAAKVHIETDFKKVTDDLSMTCKCTPDGAFSAVIDESPKDHDEWVVGDPSFLWSITPSANLTFATVTEPLVNLSLSDDAFGISYKVKVVVTWIETHSITKATNPIELKKEMVLDAVRLDGLTVETPDMINGMLCDNRTGTVNIACSGCSIETQKTLSLTLSSMPVETSGIINKVGCGTDIAFFKTTDPLKWTTSTNYWYGTLPGHCCYFNHFEYKFTAALDSKCIVTKKYAMTMPPAVAVMNPSWSNASTISEPTYNAVTKMWRCNITLRDYIKDGNCTGLPTTNQYDPEAAVEENYHLKQWKGTVSLDEGGQGDCATAVQLKGWLKSPSTAHSFGLQWDNEVPYVEKSASTVAFSYAQAAVSWAMTAEQTEAWSVWTKDQPFIEVKAKAFAGYNAAWKYHCTYESDDNYGPEEKVKNYSHQSFVWDAE
jgi:hypothetical protein